MIFNSRLKPFFEHFEEQETGSFCEFFCRTGYLSLFEHFDEQDTGSFCEFFVGQDT
jgi:hypothetical protein